MNSIYTLVDKYGFLAAYDDKIKLKAIIKEWEDVVPLMIIEFPMNPNLQKEEIYFIPYSGLESDSRFPVALCTNDKKYALATQQQMIKMDSTYPDNINFFTKKLNCIEPVEFLRLTSKDVRQREDIVDTLLTKITEADEEDLKKPFNELINGILWEPSDLLKKDSELITELKEPQN